MAKRNSTRLTDKFIRSLKPPAKGFTLYTDTEVPGFALRITSTGKTAFVLDYRINGRNRRMTIAPFPNYNATAAREMAGDYRKQIHKGIDPLDVKYSDNMAAHCDDVLTHLESIKRRPATIRNYKAMMRDIIKPELGRFKLVDIKRRDIERLHKSLADKPYQANRVLQLLSRIFALAVHWELLERNPAKGIEPFQELPRERYLNAAELKRLVQALDAHENRNRASAIVFILLTGCRKSEALLATWDQFDTDLGVWTKPAHFTKQKRVHRVPLNAAAIALLDGLPRNGDYLFHGRFDGEPIKDIRKFWNEIRKAAKLPDLRLHDLRHTYAALLASQGLSLPIIGQLLGHTQAHTTHRYAHLLDEPLKDATDRVGSLIEGARS